MKARQKTLKNCRNTGQRSWYFKRMFKTYHSRTVLVKALFVQSETICIHFLKVRQKVGMTLKMVECALL